MASPSTSWSWSKPSHVRSLRACFYSTFLSQVATCWEERLAEVGRRVKMARANLNGLLYQGEEEARVMGVLEVQQEARLIERLWEGVGHPDEPSNGEGAAQVGLQWCWTD